jgi:uncharacterized protein (TIGR00369 family)
MSDEAEREPMPDEKAVEVLNNSFVRGRNPSVQLLGGQIVSFDRNSMRMRMRFEASKQLDNGNGQVMGGFLGSMMDVAVAQLAVVLSRLTQTVATLEQKCSLLAPIRLSRDSDDPVLVFVDATAIKLGRSVAFFEISLEDSEGALAARATQTTMLVDIAPRKSKPKL